MHDAGNLPTDDYTSLLYQEIVPKIEDKKGFDYLVGAWNTYTKKDDTNAEKFFKYATGNGIVGSLNSGLAGEFADLSDAQKQMMLEIIKHVANRGTGTTNKPTSTSSTSGSSTYKQPTGGPSTPVERVEWGD